MSLMWTQGIRDTQAKAKCLRLSTWLNTEVQHSDGLNEMLKLLMKSSCLTLYTNPTELIAEDRSAPRHLH